MRMEHPPMGPVQVMLSTVGLTGIAGFLGTAGLLLGTSTTRGLSQSSPCTPGLDGTGDALMSSRCSRATRSQAPSWEEGI